MSCHASGFKASCLSHTFLSKSIADAKGILISELHAVPQIRRFYAKIAFFVAIGAQERNLFTQRKRDLVK